MRIRSHALLAMTLTTLLGACALPQEPTVTTPPPQPTFPLSLTDDEGVTVELERAPERVVAWSPGMVDIVSALEKEDLLVTGAGPAPSLAKVVSLNTDLVLDGVGGNAAWKDDLRSQGIAVFTVVSPTVDDLLHDIQTVGRLTGSTEEADELVGEMAGTISDVEKRIGDAEPVSCLATHAAPGPDKLIAPDSFEYDVLVTAGCIPVNDREKAKEVVEVDFNVITVPGPRVVEGIEAVAEQLFP